MSDGFYLRRFCLFAESNNRGSQEVYFFGFMVTSLLMQLFYGLFRHTGETLCVNLFSQH